MKNSNIKYNLINICVILVMFYIVISKYILANDYIWHINARQIVIALGTVIIVHLFKALRFFLILYGESITFWDYVKIYCKVTPVSMVLPYKSGELFKMYCYGKTVNNSLKGIIVVILDRFVDTIALVTMIFLVKIFVGGNVSKIIFLLLLFLAIPIIAYVAFPGIYSFWKKYILRAKATKSKMHFLKFLDNLNGIYLELKNVTQGRGLILYIMSLVAWGVEIVSLFLNGGSAGAENLNEEISIYLNASLGMGKSTELGVFILVSVIITIVIYMLIKITELLLRENRK